MDRFGWLREDHLGRNGGPACDATNAARIWNLVDRAPAQEHWWQDGEGVPDRGGSVPPVLSVQPPIAGRLSGPSKAGSLVRKETAAGVPPTRSSPVQDEGGRRPLLWLILG